MSRPLAKVEETQPQVVTTPQDLIEMALAKGADPDALEKLMGMQERWEANEAKKAFNVAKAAFSAACPIINKTKEGYGDAKYAGLPETLSVVKPILESNGLSVSWTIDDDSTEQVRVGCCVTHIQGHSECTSMGSEPDKSGSKNSIQARGSAVSYLQRYTLFAVLGMASAEMDDDGGNADISNEEPEYITPEQAADLESLLQETDSDKAGYLKRIKCESLETIPVIKYRRALTLLEEKKKAMS